MNQLTTGHWTNTHAGYLNKSCIYNEMSNTRRQNIRTKEELILEIKRLSGTDLKMDKCINRGRI